MIGKYKIVAIIGRPEFKEEFDQLSEYFTLRGMITIIVNGINYEGAQDAVKLMIQDIQKRKIDLSDVVYVVNPKGLLDDDTIDNIRYANEKHKIINYLEPLNNGV